MAARLPLRIGSNDAAGDQVTHWQRWAVQYAKAYAHLLGPVDGYYGLSDAAFTREMQARLLRAGHRVEVSGVFDEATARIVGYQGAPAAPPALVKPTLFTIGGTWSHWNDGFPADCARMLHDTYHWQPVGYPASFGPVNPPFPGAPSYAVSVEQGVNQAIIDIGKWPGRFSLAGYSQGAQVVARLIEELDRGRLQHRRNDYLTSVTFGDPARQKTDWTVGGGKGWGISRIVLPEGFDRLTFAVPGDMYCTTPDGQAGDQMHAVYYALTHLGTGRIDGHPALLRELLKIAADPVSGGMAVVDAVLRAIQVRAHSEYGPHVPTAVAYLRAAAWR